MSTKKVLLKTAVTKDGGIFEAGEMLELGSLSANALIAEGKAVEVSSEATGEPTDEERGKKEETHSEVSESVTDEATALLRKALNEKYNRGPLAEEAKNVGVEIPFDAKKNEIIEAIIEAGKAEFLLAK